MTTPRKVLIVEFLAAGRDSIRRLLEQRAGDKLEVFETSSVAEAVAFCRSSAPDCVIVDHSPPGCDGISAAHELNPDPLNPGLAVVIVTSERGEALAVKALKNGAQDFLVKGSFTAEELHTAISEAAETVASRRTQKQKVEDTADGEDHLQRVLDSLYIFVGVLTPDGVMVQCNSTPIKAAGQTREDVIGTHFAESFWWNYSEESNRRIRADIERAARGEQVRYDAPVRVRNERGEPQFIEVDFALTPMFDDQDRVTHLIPIGVDISDRKNAERRLKESEDRFLLAFAAVQSVIYDWNISDDTINRSAELVNLLGFDNSEPGVAHNKWWLSRLHPDDAERSSKLIKDAIENGADRFEDEYRMLHKNGNYVWVRDSGVFLKDGNGRAIRCVGSVRNVEGRKTAEQSLKISEERLNLAMQGANIGAFDWNIKTGEIQWTSETEESAAMSADEFDNSFDGFIKLVHPLDRERLSRSIDAAFLSGDYECEFRMLKGDGSLRWVIGKGRVFFDGDGEPARLVGVDIDITKRKQAEEALAESQRFTQSIVETAPSVLYLFDLESNRNTYLTEQAAKVLGYSINELETAGADFIGAYMHPDDLKRAEKHFSVIKQAPNGETYEFEYRMRHKSGEWRWFRSRDKVFRRDENGRAREILGIAADITERKRAEEELREGNERYQTLAEVSPYAIFVNVDGKISYVNRHCVELFGASSPDEIIGRSPLEFFHPEYHGIIRERVTAMRTRPQTVPTIEERIIRLDGREVCVDVSTATFLEKGKRAILVTLRDISDRKTVEAALHQSRERLAMAMDTANIYSWEIDLANGQTSWSENAARVLGFASDAMPRTVESALAFNHPEDDAVVRQEIDMVLSGKQRRFSFEQRLINPADKSIVWILAQGTAENVVDGKPTRVVGLSQNITERKQARREWEEKLRASEEFSRSVLENSPDCVKILDSEGRLEYMNENGLCLMEIDDFGRFRGQCWWDLWAPESQQMVREAVEKARRNETAHFQAFCPTAKGTPKWWDAIVRPVAGADGKPSQLISVSRDITEQRKTQERIRSSEQRFRLASDAAAALVYDADLTGKRPTIVHGLERVTGYANQESDLSADWWRSLIHPDDLPAHQQNYDRHLKKGGIYKAVYRVLHKNGQWIWVEDTAKIIKGADGTNIQLVGTIVDITQRKEAEEKLRYQLQLTQNITDSAAIAIFVTGSDGNVTFLNPEAEKMFGYAPEEIIGQDLHSMIHYQHPDGTPFPLEECPLGNVFADGKPVRDYEGTFFRKGGSPVEMVCSNMPIMENGKAVGEVMAMLDISERKRAEAAVRESEKFVRSTLNSLTPAVAILDRDGVIVDVNRAWRQFADENGCRSPRHGVGLSYLDIMRQAIAAGDSDAQPILSGLEAILKGRRRKFEFEYPCHSPNEQRWFILNASPLATEQGGAVVSHINITDRKLAEEKLRTVNYRFRLAEEAARGLNYEWNLETGVVTRSESVKRVTGYDRQELEMTWQAWADLIHPDDLKVRTEAEAIELVRASQEETLGGEYRLRHKDGHYVWVMERAMIIRDEHGNPRRVIGQTVDISERKRAEETLRQRELLENIVKFQEAERHRLARDLHDHLGQQLTGLRLALADLREKAADIPQIREKVEKTQESAQLLDKDVSLLAFELRANVLSEQGLADALENFVIEWSRNYQIHGEFHAVNQASRRRLPDDYETHLYRIAQEALNNTVKHANATSVGVILEIRDNEVRLIIEDNGVGFDPDAKPKPKTKPGHGMGLIGMKERVDLLGGSMEVDSEPGVGTTIFVSVPAPQQDSAQTAGR